MTTLSYEQATENLFCELNHAASDLVNQLETAVAQKTPSPYGVVRIVVDPVLNSDIDTLPFRCKVIAALTDRLYGLTGTKQFLLTSPRGRIGELNFTLRPASALMPTM